MNTSLNFLQLIAMHFYTSKKTDLDPSEKAKELRRAIAVAKSIGDTSIQCAKLQEYHFHILANLRRLGMRDLKRYPSFLIKHGKIDDAIKCREHTEHVIFDYWRILRVERCKQLRDFKYLRKKPSNESLRHCQQEGEMVLKNSVQARRKWANCNLKPKCECYMFGESTHSLKRKSLEPPK